MSEELNGVTATAAGSEPVAQEQTPAQPASQPDVNALVERGVQSYLANNLPTLVEREVQSRLAKQSNKAQKQFQEEKRAIERKAQRNGWDAERTRQEIEESLKAANELAFGEDEAETPPATAPTAPHVPQQPTYQNTTGGGNVPPVMSNEKELIAAHTKRVYGFTPEEVGWDVTEFVGLRDENSPLYQKYLETAQQYAAETYAQRKEAKRVRQGVEGVGNPFAVSRGTTPPPADPLAGVTDRHELALAWAREDSSK